MHEGSLPLKWRGTMEKRSLFRTQLILLTAERLVGSSRPAPGGWKELVGAPDTVPEPWFNFW